MKKLISLFLALMFISNGYGQDTRNRCGETFDARKYPSDSFSIRTIPNKLGETEIVFILLHHNYLGANDKFFQFWIEQRKNKKVLKSQYWDAPGTEYGIALPQSQPFKDYFLIYKGFEFTGTYYLINREGIWYEIPGKSLYVNADKTVLYTDVPVECGGCTIGKFDLNTQRLSTRKWDGWGIAWKENKDLSKLVDLFKNQTWIQWR